MNITSARVVWQDSGETVIDYFAAAPNPLRRIAFNEGETWREVDRIVATREA